MATVSRAFVGENKQFPSVFSVKILTHYFLTFCKVSRWFPVAPDWAVKRTESSSCLGCDFHVLSLVAEAQRIAERIKLVLIQHSAAARPCSTCCSVLLQVLKSEKCLLLQFCLLPPRGLEDLLQPFILSFALLPL